MTTGADHPVFELVAGHDSGTVFARFFGDFTLLVGGREVNRWQAGKARELFQYLLLNRGQVVHREHLFEVLWPGRTWSPTTSSLKVAAHSVRRILDDAPGAGRARPAHITSQDHGYALHADGVRLDVDELDASMAAGHDAEGRGESDLARAAYRRVGDLHTGDFLAAQRADWITERRQFHRSAALHALAWLRDDALRRHADAEVIRLCGRILGIDPCNEEAYQTLILIHGRRGELGQVREWHRLCVRRLLGDLDLNPSETTQRIFARAVRGELRTASRSFTQALATTSA